MKSNMKAMPQYAYKRLAESWEHVLNGGFETAGGGGADIWANWQENALDGVIADETVFVHSGGHACKMTAGPGVDGYNLETLTVVPNTVQQVAFWTRGDGTRDGRWGIYDVTNGAWILNRGSNHTGVPGTTYAQVLYPLTVPAGCTSIFLMLAYPAVNGGIAYFDDVSVRMSGAVVARPCGLYAVEIFGGSATSSVAFYDATSATGTPMFEADVPAAKTRLIKIPGGINFSTACYAEVVGANSVVDIWYG